MTIHHGLLPTDASPEWLNKADNAWVLIAAALVGLQSVPGLIILYGSMVRKKWAVNSAFMALYAFAAVLLCWVLWAHQMSFGSKLTPLCGKPAFALSQSYLLGPGPGDHHIPTATYVFYEFAFAAITVILIAGSLLGRMNFYAWMLFVPLWLTFSYSVGAYSIWKIIDFSGGYDIHLSSGVAGFTAAYWFGRVNRSRGKSTLTLIYIGPRIPHDRQHFPPNNIIHVLGGAGCCGWANMLSASILNTHFCTAISLLVWMGLDMYYYKKSSVSGAVQGMITGLVCITPGAGFASNFDALPVIGSTLTLSSYQFQNFQMGYQLLGAAFVFVWNVFMTSLICVFISKFVNLRMSDDALTVGDDDAHGEEAYALWG
ncbi:hypothetical protein MKW94_024436 [Papaver nudicaule]|uniref:Ammonium transporter AmtB-like domain-containing protein n=1 Tax=Papaver nudicaule TaxID=74823 RepID=A0AA41VK77_PAPNU|nr:hypothetical protein [Papaver nudicaule]